MKTIAIINESSVVTDAQLEPICQAIQVQVSRDFAPAWGIDAKIFQLWKDGCVDTEPPDGAWWLIVGDTSDELGALGYHDTTPEGLPLAKVFAKTDIEAKSSLSVTISHEVLEMLADPDISTTIIYQNSTRLLFIAREICDPCEA